MVISGGMDMKRSEKGTATDDEEKPEIKVEKSVKQTDILRLGNEMITEDLNVDYTKVYPYLMGCF